MTKMSENRKSRKGVVNSGGVDQGVSVPITDDKEVWSEWSLEDGTKVRIRPILLEARKLKKIDAHGNKEYVIKSTMIIDVQHAPKK